MYYEIIYSHGLQEKTKTKPRDAEIWAWPESACTSHMAQGHGSSWAMGCVHSFTLYPAAVGSGPVSWMPFNGILGLIFMPHSSVFQFIAFFTSHWGEGKGFNTLWNREEWETRILGSFKMRLFEICCGKESCISIGLDYWFIIMCL